MPKGRLNFEYELSDEESNVTAWGGLPFVAEVLAAMGVDESVRKHLKLSGGREFDAVTLVKTLVLLMAAGGDCLDDVRMLREDDALQKLLEMKIPSAETLRQFLYGFHDEALMEKAEREARARKEISFVPEESKLLAGLGNVLKEMVTAFAKRWPHESATVDIDATIQESSKVEAKAHYANGRGYQPTVAVWAEADFILADEFRDGNVPAQKDLLGVLKRAIEALPPTVKKRFVRGDSATNTREVLTYLCDEKIEFAVGGIHSKSFKEACLAVPAEKWTHLEDRLDSTLHLAEIPATTAIPMELGLRIIAIRFVPRQHEMFRKPQYLSVVTNRSMPAAELVHWYWDKAGTIEHVHDVVKNELGGGVLPCGRFGANAAWFRLCLITYNALRVVRETGPEDLRHAKPKRLRFNLFAIPVVLACHARKIIARIRKRLGRASEMLNARASLWLPLPV